jgi:acetyltransferase
MGVLATVATGACYINAMTIPRLAAAGRFDPSRLFHPTSVAVIGAEGAEIAARLAMDGFMGTLETVSRVEDLATAPDLAVLATPDTDIVPAMVALAAKGCFAAIVPGPADGLAEASRRTGVHVLGANSFGLAVPAIGLNASKAHIPIPAGRLALVSQSVGLTRAVIDWAGPNGVGFSHVIGIGDNAGLGFGMALDWLSQDSGTGAILLEIGRIKDRRAFLSAARAASRFRPVVALRSGGTDATVFEAALRRAGVLSVEGLEDMLAAAETLSRARPARGETLSIQAVDPGAANLASEAAARLGLRLSDPAAAGGMLVVHAPGDAMNLPTLPSGAAPPVLVCVMGETTGGPLRRELATVGWPVFASPEQAVRGFLHLVRDRRNRAAARELPGSAVLPLAPDKDVARRVFAAAAGPLLPEQARSVFAAYGIPDRMDERIAVFDDAMFGPVIALGPGPALDLPPLNLALAHALIARSPIPDGPKLAETLVRVSQLVVDCPEIASLDTASGTIVARHPHDPPARLAIAPYPSERVATWTRGSQRFTIRPIRPEDTEAHAAFFKRLSPTDVRFRFFSAMRELSPERMARLTQVDYEREMAFIAVREATGETVGAARLVSDAEGRSGEFAIVVQADMKGHGLASHLMHRLIGWARERGLSEVTGQILSDNAPMLAFIRHLGFGVHRLPDDPEVMEARLALT